MGCMVATYLANILPNQVKGIIFLSAYNVTDGFKLSTMKHCNDLEKMPESAKIREIQKIFMEKKIIYF